MTENKRFRLGYVCGDYGLIDNDDWIDLHSMSENSEKNVQICINKMNELSDENEKLNQSIQQKITDVTERTGYLFTPKQTEAVLQVLNELKNELKT